MVIKNLCASDKSSLSIGRVKAYVQHWMYSDALEHMHFPDVNGFEHASFN